ncbi:hypothetical protein KUH32_16690 [Thalassococcus sp. CAU 1522]|uniref:Uncharacterized protein n=1 Tax=Thalassococcus arenae TaxID=2851652 RepID=A0ABS6NCU1_9RHOB|nr:hypothetical protein [Thalassococcus arenae]MBV2361404.1 hypothetical protein [Thalassococcus arenae]
MSDEKELQLRRSLPILRAQNPNYFGNLSKLDLPDIPKAVLNMVEVTKYEQLTCIGYEPESEVLAAVVKVKQTSGYSGGPCTDGSWEYVRFYLDYGDGTWIDHGMAGFNIHDLKTRGDLCYAVPIHIDPKKRTFCHREPVLPRVRAILSWNDVPPPNMPNWLPVWGNVLERDIQIDPWSLVIGTILDLKDQIDVVKIDPSLLDKLKEIVEQQPPIPNPPAPLAELVKVDKDEGEMGVLRAVYPMVLEAAASKSFETVTGLTKAVQALNIDLSKFDDFILKPKFNTRYEELHCVGLDRAESRLHGVVQIKRRSGYSGGLCSKGSKEYIAFYLDFGSGWVYQGTTSVTVHNIPQIPNGGLWYQASLPVNLDPYREEWCKTGFAKIRGILSWGVPPTPYDPDHVSHWGDHEDCVIEIKPLPEGIVPGQFTPFLESIGNMALPNINAAGYATGDAVSGEYAGAKDSPFGGNIPLKGNAFFAPSPLEYQIWLKRPGDPSAQPYTTSFDVWVTTYPSTTPVKVKQIASGGWFDYLPSTTVSVAGGLLGMLSGLADGEHQVYLLFRQPAGPIIAWTTPKTFMVDNTRPVVDVEITSGTGNCGKFDKGDTISGTFKMTEVHSRSLSIYVTPTDEGKGGVMKITAAAPAGGAAVFPITETTVTAANPDGADPNKVRVTMTYNDGVLSGSGVNAGTWTLDTTDMDPCGYNIWIHGEDRTIVSGSHVGWDDWDGEGFCLT